MGDSNNMVLESASGTASASSPPAPNPMLNQEVVEILFDICGPINANADDLSQFRLVCKLWHRASLKTWRSTANLIIPGSVEMASHCRNREISRLRPLLSNPATLFDRSRSMLLQIRKAKVAIRDLEGRSEALSRACVRAKSDSVGVQLEEFLRLVRGGDSISSGDNSAWIIRLADKKPFSGFHLKYWPLETVATSGGLVEPPSSSSPESPDHIQFWSLCGPWIKRLSLEDCRFTDVSSFRTILFQTTPNLVELKIHRLGTNIKRRDSLVPPMAPILPNEAQTNLRILEIGDATFWPIGWRNMLNGFPNMKTLKLYKVACHILQRALAAVATVRMTKEGQLALKHLEIMCSGSGNHSQFPTDLLFRSAPQPPQLGLESIKMEFGTDVEESVIRQLLQQTSSTLRSLSCTRTVPLVGREDPTSWTGFQDFLGESSSSFEQLKDLRLNGPMVPNFGFLRHVPNLELLHLDYNTQEELKSLEKVGYEVRPIQDTFLPEAGGDDVVRLEKLTEFRTERLIDNHEAFLNITEWMPNVSRLSAPLTQVTFQLACGAWKSTLKELHIAEGGFIGDDEITGLGVGVRRWPEGDPILNGRPPNVTDLKELTTFTQDKGGGRFTEHAVLYGFRFLPKLQTLHIFCTPEMSAGVLELLKEKNVDTSSCWSKNCKT